MKGAIEDIQVSDVQLDKARKKLADLYSQLQSDVLTLDQANKELRAVNAELEEIDFAALEQMM